MAAGLEILTTLNVTRFARVIEDVQTLPQPLRFYDRAAKPQVNDEEITLRSRTRIYAADIVAEDTKAPIREAGEFLPETTKIAKVKHGQVVTESYIKQLNRIEASQYSASDLISWDNYVARTSQALVLGIKQREESMLIGMLLDGWNYNRMGIKLGGTWGMPSDLKFNPSITWDDDDATPITDMIAAKWHAQQKYGEIYNRVTMSLQTLTYVVRTKEFKEQFKIRNLKWEAPDSAIITANPTQYASVVGELVGMTLEVYDGVYYEYQADGSEATPERFFPENMVLFTNSSDDNGTSGWDFAQGEIMEALVGRLGGTTVIGGSVLEGFGPIGYATQLDPGLNPPGLTIWAVDRGAPRKGRPTCSAKLTAWIPV